MTEPKQNTLAFIEPGEGKTCIYVLMALWFLKFKNVKKVFIYTHPGVLYEQVR